MSKRKWKVKEGEECKLDSWNVKKAEECKMGKRILCNNL
jgi:hypothetical protein